VLTLVGDFPCALEEDWVAYVAAWSGHDGRMRGEMGMQTAAKLVEISSDAGYALLGRFSSFSGSDSIFAFALAHWEWGGKHAFRSL
jgi:hypothetical protein